ncbi:hypothetical protein ACWF94_30310 [Streptomyces sp. NPDC055078]
MQAPDARRGSRGSPARRTPRPADPGSNPARLDSAPPRLDSAPARLDANPARLGSDPPRLDAVVRGHPEAEPAVFPVLFLNGDDLYASRAPALDHRLRVKDLYGKAPRTATR